MQDDRRVPELRVISETWTRESHGLYDFEGNEVQGATYALRGSHLIQRVHSTITP